MAKTKLKLNSGEYEIKLDGETHVLKPTLAAFNRLAMLGPYDDVYELLRKRDLGTMAVVIRHGLGWNDVQSRNLADKIFRTGTFDLVQPLTQFFFSLFHHGLTMEEFVNEMADRQAKEADTGSEEGNGLTGA